MSAAARSRPGNALLRLVQLPVPPPAALAATGNVPLAAGCLAVAVRASPISAHLDADIVPPAITDRYGDTRLAELLAADEPEFLALSLYLWNVERSLHVAREVKRRSPRTRVLAGGPEVSADNALLLGQEGLDVALAGEGEEALPEILERLLQGRELAGVPGIGARAVRAATFPLARYASPYGEGLIPVEAERSAYLEAARGCRSRCTFCFYPRTQHGIRLREPKEIESRLSALRDAGAREVSFLDPTFNHRPDFDAVLEAVARANVGRRLSFFAELRPEGLSAVHAARLAKAGFTRLELGLQSINPVTLRRVGRGGSPAKLAAAAKLLRDEGVDLLIDVIVGLPGDALDDVARALDFLDEHSLGDCAQVFLLSVLPGTELRQTAARDGLVFEAAPPYRVVRSATMDEGAVREALRLAEERLGRRLDESPRPHLVAEEGMPDPPDVFRLDLDQADGVAREAATRAGAQHVALWLEAGDLFARRDDVLRAIEARLRVDPYATLDVVLSPGREFPLDLLDAVRRRLEAAPPSYASRLLAHRGEDYQRRVSVVLGATAQVSSDWLRAVMDHVPVFRDQPLRQAAEDAEQLGDALPGARIVDGSADDAAVARLEAEADPEAVTFADRKRESRWQRRAMGYADAG